MPNELCARSWKRSQRVMNESRKQFADQLAACETPNPSRRERYEKELRAMLENKLTANEKRNWIIIAVLCLLGIALTSHIGIASVTFATPEFRLPTYIGAAFFVITLALVLAVRIVAHMLWTNTYNRHTHGKALAIIGVASVGLVGWIFVLGARYTPEVLQDD